LLVQQSCLFVSTRHGCRTAPPALC
jgi:hypothetical protein